MTLDDFNLIVDGMACRSLASPFTCQAPQGIFHHLNFPMTEADSVDCNPSVHYLDVVKNYHLDITIEELERKYKDAILNKDLQLLPAPFGLRSKVQSDCKIQIVLSEFAEGSYIIIKHIIFPQKSKLSVVKKLVYGTVYRPLFMHVPTVGRKILQYCLQNMGGTQLRCFDCAADAPTAKSRKVFDDLEDEGLDQGFDFIAKHAPRSSCDLAQLRWQTKELRKSTSPIFGWPQNLVQQALRQLSSEGALARKDTYVLSALASGDLGGHLELRPLCFGDAWWACLWEKSSWPERVDGPMPLQQEEVPGGWRALHQVQSRDWLFEGWGRHCYHGRLPRWSIQTLGLKALKSLLDVGLYESMSWARWGAVKWVQNQPRDLLGNGASLPLQRSHQSWCGCHLETCHFSCQYQAVRLLQEELCEWWPSPSQVHSWGGLLDGRRQEVVRQV